MDGNYSGGIRDMLKQHYDGKLNDIEIEVRRNNLLSFFEILADSAKESAELNARHSGAYA